MRFLLRGLRWRQIKFFEQIAPDPDLNESRGSHSYVENGKQAKS
jgi:hypothetical protein